VRQLQDDDYKGERCRAGPENSCIPLLHWQSSRRAKIWWNEENDLETQTGGNIREPSQTIVVPLGKAASATRHHEARNDGSALQRCRGRER